MTRTPLRLLVLLAASFAAITLAVPAQAASPYCGITWGSQAKEGTPSGSGEITDVRSGQHGCYDRLVIDLRGTGSPASWNVRYVPQVREDPTDRPVPLRGGAFLQIAVQAPDHDLDYVLTYRPANRNELVDVAGYRTFRQVAHAGSFEAVTSFGVGVRARLPFRVLELSGPGHGSRIAIDVAHRW